MKPEEAGAQAAQSAEAAEAPKTEVEQIQERYDRFGETMRAETVDIPLAIIQLKEIAAKTSEHGVPDAMVHASSHILNVLRESHGIDINMQSATRETLAAYSADKTQPPEAQKLLKLLETVVLIQFDNPISKEDAIKRLSAHEF